MVFCCLYLFCCILIVLVQSASGWVVRWGSLDGLVWFALAVITLCLCLIVICNVSCWFGECL